MAQVAVTRVLWSSPEAVIFSGVEGNGSRVIVRLSEKLYPVVGEVYEVCGIETEYVDERGLPHRQIDADRADRIRTSGALVGPWLRSLPGIGAERAERIQKVFGQDALTVLESPQKIGEIAAVLAPRHPNLGPRLAAIVQAKVVQLRAEERGGIGRAEFYGRLEGYGVTDRRAAATLCTLFGGMDAWSRLLERPYTLVAVLPWTSADHVAQRLLADRDDASRPLDHPERLISACDAAWQAILGEGHTAATEGEFLSALTRLGVPPSASLAAGIEASRVVVQGALLRAPGALWLERSVANDLQGRIAASGRHRRQPDWERIVRSCETPAQPLTEEQRRAVTVALGRNVSVIQGAAGTGKSTMMRVAVQAWEANGGKVILAALSGKAAFRLSSTTEREAFTLARLENSWSEMEKQANAAKTQKPRNIPIPDSRTMLVVDEASMVDLVTWRRLSKRLPIEACLVLVGDIAQLPPVGLGRVYHDIVDADLGYVSRLSRILRQAEDSPIVVAANAVRRGQTPTIPSYRGAGPGVFLLECRTKDIMVALEHVWDDLTADGTPLNGMLVLAALNASCRRFCQIMQDRRRMLELPGVRLGPLAPWVTVGDPLIITRNRYDCGLLNSQLGWVTAVSPLVVHFDGESIAREVDQDLRADMKSAWAITGHRAQGSEAERVIVLLDGSSLVTREWLYTALTRGKQQVVLVGTRGDLSAAVNRRSLRRTAFGQELTSVQEGGRGGQAQQG